MKKHTAAVTNADPPLSHGFYDIYLASEVDARIAKFEEVAGMALGALNAGISIQARSVIHDELKSLMVRESQ